MEQNVHDFERAWLGKLSRCLGEVAGERAPFRLTAPLAVPGL